MQEIKTKDINSLEKMQKDNSDTVSLLLALSKRHPKAAAEAADISECSTIWEFDAYPTSKTMVLHKTNRCKSKFCPICRKTQASRRFHNLKPKLRGKYQFLHLTLTVPNVSAGSLAVALDTLAKSITALWQNISANSNKQRKYKKGVSIPDAIGAYRSIEVTYNKKFRTWHPHLHVLLVYPLNVHLDVDEKFPIGVYDKIRHSEVEQSPLEVSISNLWRDIVDDLAPDGLLRTSYAGGYMVKIERVYNVRQLREVVGYIAKGSDMKSMTLDAFEELYLALRRRRATQSYGCLYGKVDVDVDVDVAPDQLPEGEAYRLELSRDEMRDYIADGWRIITFLPGYAGPEEYELSPPGDPPPAAPPPIEPEASLSLSLQVEFKLA